jgi:protein-L-isoaspartate(D-aspartate) O-methyltransferase
MSLIDNLISSGYLKTPLIIEAFRKVRRVDFLPDEFKYLDEVDEALPIGQGQTISQPAVVAFMLELLEPKPGDNVLDIGSGSNWTTALLAYVVSQKGNSKQTQKPSLASARRGERREQSSLRTPKPKVQTGQVIAMEIIPELKEFGEKNVARYNFIKKGIVKCVCGDGFQGYSKEAPYDKILVSAAVYPVRNKTSNGISNCPQALKDQLKLNGRIVIPIENSIWLLIKRGYNFGKGDYQFEEHEYPGFVFVPLIEADTRG